MSQNIGLKIDSEKRFNKFVEKIKKSQLVWGLKSKEGWCIAPSNDFENVDVMPFWSESAYAKQCALEEWAIYAPESIPLEEFVKSWLPGMDEDDLLVGTDWNSHLIGKEIEPLELLAKWIETK